MIDSPDYANPLVTCPHCDGYGEEPGAPSEADGVFLCCLCGGKGEVTHIVAEDYQEEQQDLGGREL